MEQEKLSLNDIWKELFCEKETQNIYLNAMSGIVEKKYAHVLEKLDKEVPQEDILDYQNTDAFNNYAIECRKKLNEMFEALLGCKYEEILKKEGTVYEFSKDTAHFIKVLIAIYRKPEGKAIRNKKYFISDLEDLQDELDYGKLIYYSMEELAKEGGFKENWEQIKSRLDIHLKNPLRILKSQILCIQGIINGLSENEEMIEEKVVELNAMAQILQKCQDELMDIAIECNYKNMKEHEEDLIIQLKKL